MTKPCAKNSSKCFSSVYYVTGCSHTMSPYHLTSAQLQLCRRWGGGGGQTVTAEGGRGGQTSCAGRGEDTVLKGGGIPC